MIRASPWTPRPLDGAGRVEDTVNLLAPPPSSTSRPFIALPQPRDLC
jgi:hypothetical protein